MYVYLSSICLCIVNTDMIRETKTTESPTNIKYHLVHVAFLPRDYELLLCFHVCRTMYLLCPMKVGKQQETKK